MRRKLGLPSEGPIVIFAGPVIERKGTDLIPPIFRKVATAFPSACMLFLGRYDASLEAGCTTERIKSQLAEYLATGQVIFTGIVPNVHEYLKASDVFLFPSRREGLPNAPMEAMACGLPCIVRNIEGQTSFYINNGVDGVIVPDENTAAYAEIIIRLLSNETEYRAMSTNARARILSSSAADVVDRQYRLIYEKLLGTRTAPAWLKRLPGTLRGHA